MERIETTVRLGDVRELNRIFSKLGETTDAWFSWAISENRIALGPFLERLKMVETPPERFKEYEKKQVGIFEKYSNIGKNGLPIPPKQISNVDGTFGYVFDIKDQEECDKAQNALAKKYKQVIRANSERINSISEVHNLDVEISFVQFDRSEIDVPLTSNEATALRSYKVMVWDDEPPRKKGSKTKPATRTAKKTKA